MDGFRFDLASALARELHEVDRLGAFFDVLRQDPVLSQVKLIAEPWDLGEGGYQVGNFPMGWAEWNDRYRDTMRAYWKGDGGLIGDFAQRLTGSSDLYESSGRKPYASVNFVAAHDGFTLNDLVSYNDKHNEANLDDNRDGHDNNRSWNCGAEGPSDDPEVRALRARQKTQSAGHADVLAGHADAAVRRRNGPQPAREQQRLLPGQRNQLAQLGSGRGGQGAAGVYAARDRLAPCASGIPSTLFLRWSGNSRFGRQGHRLVQAGRRRDERCRMGPRPRPQSGYVALGRCHRGARQARSTRSATTASCFCSTPITKRFRSSSPRAPSTASGVPFSTPISSRGLAANGAFQGGHAYTLQGRSLALMIQERH